MTNLKAVIPVAGLGMHMLPATKAIPKEMLPIVDKPMIQYIVDEIVAAGIKEILLVTHASKNAVENHFDTSYELESLLEQRVKRQLLAEVQSICPPGVTIMNVRQGEPLGLGHSILCAPPVTSIFTFLFHITSEHAVKLAALSLINRGINARYRPWLYSYQSTACMSTM
jgi:UTP--glucose-1-phosphate uridylyltransferase